MDFREEFNLLLKARYSLIYIETYEEDRLEYTIRHCIRFGKIRSLYTWNFIDGFENALGKRNPLQALEFIEKKIINLPSIFLLKDFNRFFSDFIIIRKLRNLFRLLKTQPKTVIISANAPETLIEDSIRDVLALLEFPLPDVSEIRQELGRVLNLIGGEITKNTLNSLVKSCQGLSLEGIRRVLSKVIATNQIIDESIIQIILREKQHIINKKKILEFCSSDYTLADIGGLTNLKLWLKLRSRLFTEKASHYGLGTPRGLLLVGVQGTGKSLTAKAIANEWRLPLLRLDFGCLFAGILGESESRVREMIKVTEALAPCILWVEELDKYISQLESLGDSGTTNRVLGTFITWLSEKISPVFIVATANNFEHLPLELIRKGRFDEIFFFGLPTESERKKIFQVLLLKIRPDRSNEFNTIVMAHKSKDFSGSEILQAIIEGMRFAFNEDRDFENEDILDGIQDILPLARIENKKTKIQREWGFSGQIRNASVNI
jgi:ATP-dependent 26S proteasome regulatory subunit